jgi:hydroxyacylglutathione hydrolase
MLSRSGTVELTLLRAAQNDDVVFRQIDEHTWIGTAHVMAKERLYLLEATNRALLMDAGTRVADLDKVITSITKKPVMLVATHAHPAHTGSAINYFPELNINPGDAGSSFLASYKGKINALTDGQVIDLGGRTVQVVFTPGHTPGATTFIDKDAGYGFSGDSFGSGKPAPVRHLLHHDCDMSEDGRTHGEARDQTSLSRAPLYFWYGTVNSDSD